MEAEAEAVEAQQPTRTNRTAVMVAHGVRIPQEGQIITESLVLMLLLERPVIMDAVMGEEAAEDGLVIRQEAEQGVHRAEVEAQEEEPQMTLVMQAVVPQAVKAMRSNRVQRPDSMAFPQIGIKTPRT